MGRFWIQDSSSFCCVYISSRRTVVPIAERTAYLLSESVGSCRWISELELRLRMSGGLVYLVDAVGPYDQWQVWKGRRRVLWGPKFYIRSWTLASAPAWTVELPAPLSWRRWSLRGDLVDLLREEPERQKVMECWKEVLQRKKSLSVLEDLCF